MLNWAGKDNGRSRLFTLGLGLGKLRRGVGAVVLELVELGQ
jgi:hypothetical protein